MAPLETSGQEMVDETWGCQRLSKRDSVSIIHVDENEPSLLPSFFQLAKRVQRSQSCQTYPERKDDAF